MIGRGCRDLLAVAALVLVLGWPAPARAAAVVTLSPLVLRDRPSPTGKLVDRVEAGQRLRLLQRSGDGAWLKLAGPVAEGWVPAAEVTELDDKDAGGTAAPLAGRRKVRPEAWVAESRYHDGVGPGKVIVMRPHTDLVARPSDGAQVVGGARRGEQLVVVRTSRDGRWHLVELGGGEVAWVAASAVRDGGAAPLAPRISPVEGEVDDAPASNTAEPDDATASKSAPRAAAEPNQAPPRATRTRATRSTGGAPPTIAAIDEGEPPSPPAGEGAGSSPAASTETPRRHASFAAAGGFGSIGQRFTSNTHGRLVNYEASTLAVAAAATLDLWLRLGGRVIGGLSVAYRFAGAAGINVATPAGPVVLGLQSHDLEANLQIGYRAAALGGFVVALRAGGEMLIDVIDQDARAPLPSERITALAVGVHLEAPSLWQGLGASLDASVLPFGDRAQTGGLGEGDNAGTLGYAVGGALAYTLGSGVSLVLAGRYAYAATHFEGVAQRVKSITSADRVTTLSWLTLGIVYTR